MGKYMTEFFKGKKVLVAGGTGFVGVNLINKLLALGAHVRATIHKKSPVLHDPRIEYVTVDLTLAQDCAKATNGVDHVFMCAANTSGAGVMATTPLVHVTPNVIMNTLLLDAAYTSGVKKFLWLSSNTVYPAVEYPVKEHEMVPGDVFEKYFCVAWMKQFTEILCRMYAEKIPKPMNVVVVRPANIYGPYDDFEWATSHVLPALMRKVVERMAPLEVWGDGNDIKDFIYIDDFIDGTVLAMEKIDSYDPINIGSGKETTIRQALKLMLECDGYADAKVVYNTSKPTMIPKRMLDVSKAKKVLGFEAKTTMAEGIKRTMEWYRNSQNQKA
jgi:GDP-L-fucose synthase